MQALGKQLVVIAGPAGSGKDSIAKRLLKRYSNMTMMVTATTRPMREGEAQRVNYYFFTNSEFKKELSRGNILEHYYRDITDTYYGTYKPDVERKIASGKVVIAIVQIVGAKYLKENYGATTIFIMPPSLEALERRARSRASMSDSEWRERVAYTENEVGSESPWYDYRISNEDGKLDDAVESVVSILKKEGYTLQ